MNNCLSIKSWAAGLTAFVLVFMVGCGTTSDYKVFVPTADGMPLREMEITAPPNTGSGPESDLVALLPLNSEGDFIDTRISMSPVNDDLVFSMHTGHRAHMNVYTWRTETDNENGPVDVTRDIDRINVEPTFDPKGEFIYYSSNYPDARLWKLWRFDLVDGTRTQISDDGSTARVDTSPTLSPDGRRIAFASYDRDGGQPRVIVADADGGNAQRKATGHSPSWSPNGRLIAYVATDAESGLDRIMVLDLESDTTSVLTRGSYHDRHPTWTPDGELIVFSTNRVVDEDGHRHFTIWQMDAQGRNARPLTFSTYHDMRPVVSSDGETIFFVSNRGSVAGEEQIWRIWKTSR